jgi:hypothetical protein
MAPTRIAIVEELPDGRLAVFVPSSPDHRDDLCIKRTYAAHRRR